MGEGLRKKISAGDVSVRRRLTWPRGKARMLRVVRVVLCVNEHRDAFMPIRELHGIHQATSVQQEAMCGNARLRPWQSTQRRLHDAVIRLRRREA